MVWRYTIAKLKEGNSNNPPQNKQKGPRINEQIRVPEIRLIGDDGTQYGVVTMVKALQIAEEAQLDLVEVSPSAKPPVVKLIDFGKFKYQQQKKAAEAKKKQVVIAVKEIKFRPAIDTHDLQVKMKNVLKFLEQGDKVKLLMQFRGRELAHKDIGLGKFEEIINQVIEQSQATVESPMKLMGNRAIAMLAPSKKK